MTPFEASTGELVLFQTDDGGPRSECRSEGDSIWLTQLQLAELFETSVPNINLHLKAVYEEGDPDEGVTIKPYSMVRAEGKRSVSRHVLHYSLPATNEGPCLRWRAIEGDAPEQARQETASAAARIDSAFVQRVLHRCEGGAAS